MTDKQKPTKATETQHLICDAFFALLKDKSFEELTVSEICAKAGVARKTFYNNFTSKSDIVGLSIDNFFNSHEALLILERSQPEIIYRSAFEFVDENRDLFLLLYRRNLFNYAEERLIYYCQSRWPADLPVNKRFAEYFVSAMVSLFVSILKNWIKNGFTDSIDDLVTLAASLMYSGKR